LFAAGVAEDTVASTTHGPAKWSGGGGRLLLGEAFTAEDGAILRGAEGDSGLLATLGAGRPSFDTREVVSVAQGLRGSKNGDALGLAGFAALGLVLELFVVEKQLFPGGKNEVGAAVDAGQYLILKFH
jgi:hypothetical protein